jgi:hypothetical protein
MEFGQLKSAIDLLGFLDLGLTRSESSLGRTLGHHLDFSSLCHHRVYAIIWIFACFLSHLLDFPFDVFACHSPRAMFVLNLFFPRPSRR